MPKQICVTFVSVGVPTNPGTLNVKNNLTLQTAIIPRALTLVGSLWKSYDLDIVTISTLLRSRTLC